MMKWRWIAALVLFAGLSGAMHADTLTYTLTVSGSGSLDGVPYGGGSQGGAAVTFTMTTDAANATATSVSGLFSVTIPGVGMDLFAAPLILSSGYFDYVYLDQVGGSGDISLFLPQGGCVPHNCPPLDLTRPYRAGGGVSDSATFNTAHGTLEIQARSPFASYFEITGAKVAPTPEPSSFVLLGSGALGLLTMLRKRNRIQGTFLR